MKIIKFCYSIIIATAVLTATACFSSDTTKVESNELSAMDSVSKNLEKSNKELDEQAKKVEASIERLDKELTSTN
jgi:septal ring factor EnvC (AmiA/AmiB activator)